MFFYKAAPKSLFQTNQILGPQNFLGGAGGEALRQIEKRVKGKMAAFSLENIHQALNLS